MIKLIVFAIILSFHFQLWSQDSAEAPPVIPSETPAEVPVDKLQKPLGRVKSNTGTNSESSSFIGDPDNLDPMNPNRDNLKDDEEPVLEDIRQILNAPKNKAQVKSSDTTTVKPSEGSASTKKNVETPATKKTRAQVKKPKQASLNPDDPDLKLEKKFNNIYRLYNYNPTAENIWAEASAKQTSQKYSVQKGDTLWSISKILFGDPNFWPKLWSLNKQGILNPHFIKPNTFIYFFAGDDESAPTLSVGSSSAVDYANLNDRAHETKSVDRPGKIPDSLPLSRNENYFIENKSQDIRIDMGTYPQFNAEYLVEIFLTDQKLKSEVDIQISEAAKFRCYEGRLIKEIKYRNKLLSDYDLFEPIDTFKTNAGVIYAYRAYGSAQPYLEKNLKITNCKGLLTTDLVFLPKDKIYDLKSQKITPTKKAKLIGGPDVVSQRLFLLNQVAYADFGSTPYEPGQEFKVQSQVTDRINGTVRVIEKYGSLAVVMVMEVDDVMEIGDPILLN
jgi:LysM repeat protein